jgi:chorismate mutase
VQEPASTGHADVDEQLAAYRASIDNIDAALVHLLAERFKITKAVGRHKAAIGLPAMDPAREDQQVTRLRALAGESGLDPAFTEAFLRFVISEVIRHHEENFDRPPEVADRDSDRC